MSHLRLLDHLAQRNGITQGKKEEKRQVKMRRDGGISNMTRDEKATEESEHALL
jgi:hypothetical protein